MNRRSTLAWLFSTALAPGALAQAPRVARVVYAGQPPKDWVQRLVRWFEEQGYVEGRSLELRFEFIRGTPIDKEARGRAIIAGRPDAIIVPGWDMAFLFKGLTHEVPLVLMNFGGDPVRLGLVASLREPGGNVTGSCQQLMEMTPKLFEVLLQLRPGARRGGVLMVERSLRGKHLEQGREEMARAGAGLGMEIVEVIVPDDPTILDIRSAVGRSRVDVLLVPEDVYRKPVLPELLGYLRDARIPAMYLTPSLAHQGGLVSIWPDWAEGAKAGVEAVVRILRGERPAMIPVYRVGRHSLAINRRTARAMGIEIPASLLLGAAEVID